MKIKAAQWQQLSELLDTALELAADERLQWVDALSEELAELKPTLRELLLQTTGVETKDFLDRPPDFAAALMADSTHTDWAEEFQVDKVMGAYRLIRELGRGGMGTVWLAERIDGKLKRQVALKFPYAGPNQRQLAERLAREREILASLEHPNIARLYDADVTASGQPFLVLEYINGMPISEYCDHHQLSIDERLKLFQQVLDAVRYAHSHLVIHRDLKPSNILITSDGIAHLLDFGIAKLTEDGEVKETALTQIGGRAFTPDYASPEQLTRESITTVSDVYSLGILLYELLTGTRPYRLQRSTRHELEDAIIKADVVVPSGAEIDEQIAANRKTSIRQLHKSLNGDMDTLIIKAVKKNPAERYASVDAFHEDIKRYLDHQPILAQPDSQWYRTRKFMNRNRLGVASAIAITLTLVIGSGAALWQAHQAKLQRDRAVASAARSEAVTDFLQLMVTEVADADEPITMQSLLTHAEEIANKTFSNNVDQQIAILNALGEYYLGLQKTDLANRTFSKALDLAHNTSDLALKGNLMCRLALAKSQLGEVDPALAMINQGMSLTQQYPEVQAECLYARSYLRYQSKDGVSGMIEDLELAQSKLNASNVSRPLLSIEFVVGLADAEAQLGNSAAAIRKYESAIEQLEKLGRGDQSLAMLIQAKCAAAQVIIGNPERALEYIDRARAIAEKRGMHHGEAENFLGYRAASLIALGRYEEALQSYKSIMQYAESNHNIPTMVDSQQGLVRVLLSMNRIGEAQQMMQDIRKLAARTELTKTGVYLVHMTLLEGMLEMKQQHYQRALDKFSTAMEFFESHHETGNGLAYVLMLRSEAYLAVVDLVAAGIDAARAYDIATKVQGEAAYSRSSGAAALLLAKISHAQNKNDDAHKWANIAFEQLQGSVGAQHPNTLEAKQLLASVSAISK